MNLPPNHDWLDEVARSFRGDIDMARLRHDLRDRPRELARLYQELALNRVLDGLPCPVASADFAERVLERIDRDPDRESFLARVRSRMPSLGSLPLPSLPRLAFLATMAVAIAFGWQHLEFRRNVVLARSAAELSGAAVVPGVAVLGDFDAIRLLDARSAPDDVALMQALREPAP